MTSPRRATPRIATPWSLRTAPIRRARPPRLKRHSATCAALRDASPRCAELRHASHRTDLCLLPNQTRSWRGSAPLCSRPAWLRVAPHRSARQSTAPHRPLIPPNRSVPPRRIASRRIASRRTPRHRTDQPPCPRPEQRPTCRSAALRVASQRSAPHRPAPRKKPDESPRPPRSASRRGRSAERRNAPHRYPQPQPEPKRRTRPVPETLTIPVRGLSPLLMNSAAACSPPNRQARTAR